MTTPDDPDPIAQINANLTPDEIVVIESSTLVDQLDGSLSADDLKADRATP